MENKSINRNKLGNNIISYSKSKKDGEGAVDLDINQIRKKNKLLEYIILRKNTKTGILLKKKRKSIIYLKFNIKIKI